ncbi:MAG: hypothetical protein FD123_1252 [Bacteroidetes bacterium]|nr:MAG: hypothetical protein FD123_1252 [Bacteroidota bacterium]
MKIGGFFVFYPPGNFINECWDGDGNYFNVVE